MSVVLATNSIEAISAGATRYTAGNGIIDSDYTDDAIRMESSSGGMNYVMEFFDTPSGDEVFFHFRYRVSSAAVSNFTDGTFLALEEADGTEVALLRIDSGDFQVRAVGDSNVNGSLFTLSQNTVYTFDIHVNVNDGGDLTVTAYVDGVSSSTATAANTGGKTVPTQVRFRFQDMNASGGNAHFFSEFIADDADSTVGCRLAQLRPDGDSTDTGWTGDWNDLADEDDGTFIEASSASLSQSWTLEAYSGAGSPTEVRAVVNEYKVQTFSSGPTSLTPYLKISSTDYDASAVDVGGNFAGLEYAVWAENPNTTSAWAVADLANLVAGIEV